MILPYPESIDVRRLLDKPPRSDQADATMGLHSQQLKSSQGSPCGTNNSTEEFGKCHNNTSLWLVRAKHCWRVR